MRIPAELNRAVKGPKVRVQPVEATVTIADNRDSNFTTDCYQLSVEIFSKIPKKCLAR